MKIPIFPPLGKLCLLLALLAVVSPLAGAEAPPTPSQKAKHLEISVTPSKPVVMSGEPFHARVTVNNNSALDFPSDGPSWWYIILTVTTKDGRLVEHTFIPFGKGRPVPQLPAHEKIAADYPLPLPPGEIAYGNPRVAMPLQPGEYVLSAQVVFWNEEDESDKKYSASVSAPLTVIPADKAKMGAIIDELGRRALTLSEEDGYGYAEAGDALTKLASIDDERTAPWLARLLHIMPKENKSLRESLTTALSKLHQDVVDRAMKETEEHAPGETPPDPKPDPVALKKAVESGDAWRVRELVVQGTDIRPFAEDPSLVGKFWTAPLDKTTPSPELTIQVPAQVKRDTKIPIHITFKNTGTNTRFVNPGMNHKGYAPAGILLFDEKKRCIGDLLDFSGQNLSGGVEPGQSHPGWIDAGQTREIDGTFRIRSKVLTQVERDEEENVRDNPPIHLAFPDAKPPLRTIPPGHYYVQCVYWLRFAAPPPDSPGNPVAAVLEPLKHSAVQGTRLKYETLVDKYYGNPVWSLPLYRSNVIALDVD